MELPSIVEIENAFANTDFGKTPKETVIRDTLTKVTQGYGTGRTAETICKELGLILNNHLTPKGCCYINKYGFTDLFAK